MIKHLFLFVGVVFSTQVRENYHSFDTYITLWIWMPVLGICVVMHMEDRKIMVLVHNGPAAASTFEALLLVQSQASQVELLRTK